MKANELRIGNYVNRLGEPTIIEAIQKGVGIDYVSTPKSGAITINQIEPIPLIEEILLKCRFKKTPANNSYYLPIPKLKAEIHFEIFRGGLVCVLYCSTGSFIPNDIKYLHELQNLYFSLTNEELKINL